MQQRIREMAEYVMSGKAWFETTPIEYDRADILLHPIEMQAKHLYEFITNQKPQISERSALAGYFRFDGSVEGDIFTRLGHKAFGEMIDRFYTKPYRNLATFEWQHSEGNFKHIMDVGIDGIKAEIENSKKRHTEREELLFLNGLDTVCDAIIAWANKCADEALEKSKETTSASYKNNLEKLSKTLRKIPQKPADSFYEAILCIYVCFPLLPDSIGLIDRQLTDFYRNDIETGILTEEDAAAYLQELFLMLQAKEQVHTTNFYRGGQSHFCVGGYLADGSDGYNELTELIIRALTELPTFIPQISLRVTKKTPPEVFRFVMECERRDKYKRFAFVSDEPRIKALTEIAGFPFEQAVNYTMTGCNEPVMTGGRILGTAQQNILRSMANTFQNRAKELIEAKSFDEFYAVYESELFADIAEMIALDNEFTKVTARDCNLASSIFLNGCIENAKSATQGGAHDSTATMDLIGITSSIDSLAIVKQFVFDEKRVSMKTLVEAIRANWQGYDDLRTEIIKCGKFFGNDDEETNSVARRFTGSIYSCLKEKQHCFGKKYLVGNLIGYHPHHKWFGSLTAATPDGRRDGDPMSFGIGQSDGKDRRGLTALLNSIITYDPHHIMNGPTVTNILLDQKLVTNDAYFNKVVTLLYTYLTNGGTHFQLTYVSKEDLIAAKNDPDKYQSLRVRVSGFSDFFVNLNDALQDEILTRTVKGD